MYNNPYKDIFLKGCMKSLILSDFHGRCPLKFIKAQRRKGIDRLVSLGDYDDPEILEGILDLDMDKILLVGNHDYNFVNGEVLSSGYLEKSAQEYFEDWERSPDAKDFVLGLGDVNAKRARKRNGYKVVGRVGDLRAAYIHGSLAKEGDDYLVWGRLCEKDWTIRENFRQMQKLRYDVLIRGHDHMAAAISLNKGDQAYHGEINLESDNPVILSGDKRYILGMGSFVEGDYAVLDDSDMSLKYGNID